MAPTPNIRSLITYLTNKIKCCSAHVSFSSSFPLPVIIVTMRWFGMKHKGWVRHAQVPAFCFSRSSDVPPRSYALNSWHGSILTSEVFSLNCVQISSVILFSPNACHPRVAKQCELWLGFIGRLEICLW
ncbi:unnamed protein product [Pipistrellus nathusii]|uniref:Uncharacterized protein n=1 Tax=Pipistrellus nathusii TaxID=59473 RepID=A0ABN9ZS89_PIPNA